MLKHAIASHNLPDMSSEVVVIEVGKAPPPLRETLSPGINACQKEIAETQAKRHPEAHVATGCIGNGIEPTMRSDVAVKYENSGGHTNEHTKDGDDNEQNSTKHKWDTDRKTFFVHKSVLCKSSRFFQTATKPEWSPQEHRPIDLTDEIPEIFQLYLQWLYTDKLSVKFRPVKKTNEEGEEWDAEQISLSHLIGGYLLGEKLMDGQYQTAIIRTLIGWVMNEDTYPANFLVQWAYQGTTEGSPLRRLLVDFWTWEAHAAWVTDKLVEDTCVEFAQDVILALVKDRPQPTGDDSGKDMRPWIAAPDDYTPEG